jgi:hypothetical protein
MRLINRSKQSPLGRQACDAALAKHVELYGAYGRQKTKADLYGGGSRLKDHCRSC